MEDSTIPAVEADLRAARTALFEDKEVRDFLASRVVGRLPKRRLVLAPSRERWTRGCSRCSCSWRSAAAPACLVRSTTSTSGLSRIARGVRRATILSAFPLGDEEKDASAPRWRGATGARWSSKTEIRPSLIGGVLALSEGQEIEFTAAGQLTDLHDRL